MVLERPELRLGVGVIVQDVGTRMSALHPQVGQQHGERLRGHCGYTIGMDRQLARRQVHHRCLAQWGPSANPVYQATDCNAACPMRELK